MNNPLRLLMIQILTIPLVILVFKLPGEKATLSLIANTIFWLIGVLTVIYRGPLRLLILLAGIQFLLTSVLPVSLLRYKSWGGDFNSSTLFGIAGSQWHSYSNISFMVMICASIAVYFITFLQKKQTSS